MRMEEFKNLKDYLRESYVVHETRTDIYAYFIEQSLDLLAAARFLGFVVSNKWLRSNYGRKLRELLIENTTVSTLIDFGDLPVFEATTYPLVMGIQAKISDKDHLVLTVEVRSLTSAISTMS